MIKLRDSHRTVKDRDVKVDRRRHRVCERVNVAAACSFVFDFVFLFGFGNREARQGCRGMLPVIFRCIMHGSWTFSSSSRAACARGVAVYKLRYSLRTEKGACASDTGIPIAIQLFFGAAFTHRTRCSSRYAMWPMAEKPGGDRFNAPGAA